MTSTYYPFKEVRATETVSGQPDVEIVEYVKDTRNPEEINKELVRQRLEMIVETESDIEDVAEKIVHAGPRVGSPGEGKDYYGEVGKERSQDREVLLAETLPAL